MNPSLRVYVNSLSREGNMTYKRTSRPSNGKLGPLHVCCRFVTNESRFLEQAASCVVSTLVIEQNNNKHDDIVEHNFTMKCQEFNNV